MSTFPLYAGYQPGNESREHAGRTPVSVENVRYRVPEWHGYGPDFPTLGEAVVHAEERAREPVGEEWAGEGKHPRVFVERRALVRYAEGGAADMMLDRIEVFV